MSGVKFLLDTNVIIGLLNRLPTARSLVAGPEDVSSAYGYSAVTRMELLGFWGITEPEKAAIESMLSQLIYFPVTRAVEDATIVLRQTLRVKLPDAIIAATAQVAELKLLTLDEDLKRLSEQADVLRN